MWILNKDKNLVNCTSHVPRTAVPSIPDDIVGGSGLQVPTSKQKIRGIKHSNNDFRHITYISNRYTV